MHLHHLLCAASPAAPQCYQSCWLAPLSGKWHVGVKHLYELVPAGLKKRIKEDRRKRWDEQQAACVATAWTDLSQASKAAESSKTKDAQTKLNLKKMKEEHQARTELLKEMTAKYEDTGDEQFLLHFSDSCPSSEDESDSTAAVDWHCAFPGRDILR